MRSLKLRKSGVNKISQFRTEMKHDFEKIDKIAFECEFSMKMKTYQAQLVQILVCPRKDISNFPTLKSQSRKCL